MANLYIESVQVAVKKKWIFPAFILIVLLFKIQFPTYEALIFGINGTPKALDLYVKDSIPTVGIIVFPASDSCPSCITNFQDVSLFNDLLDSFPDLRIISLTENEDNEKLVSRLEDVYAYKSQRYTVDGNLLRRYLNLAQHDCFLIINSDFEIVSILQPFQGENLSIRLKTYLDTLQKIEGTY